MIVVARCFLLICLLISIVNCSNTNITKSISRNVEPRIVGGTMASIRRFPYQVSILYDGNHICGGTIIAYRFILTAAHCVVNTTRSRFSIRGGSSRWGRGGVIARVGAIVYHKYYNPRNNNNDIAIMRILGSFRDAISRNLLQTIPLATRLPTSLKYLFITGWGVRQSGADNIPQILRKVLVRYMPRRECNRLLNNRLTKRMICAGYVQGGKDACQGDSGGPLAFRNGRALLGVVSWGDGCGSPGKPGVYVSVPFFVNWIKAVCRKWS